MKYAILMAEGSPFKKLEHEASDSIGIKSTSLAMGVHVTFEILVAELEDEYQFCFRMDHVVQADDVDVLEFLHERDLSYSSRWCALLRIEMDLLQSDNLIGRTRSTL